MRGMSTCKKCVAEKIDAQGSYLACLNYEKDLSNGKVEKVREFLCQVGPHKWCAKFCNMPDRKLELRFHKEFPEIIRLVKPLWTSGNPH